MHSLVERAAHNVKKIRMKVNLTQAEVEARAKFSRGYVSLLENGRRNATLETMEKIAKVMGVDPSELAKEF